MLILNSGYRQVTLHQTSKNSSRPVGREPSELLALGVNFGGFELRETRAESSSIYKVRTGVTRNPLVNNELVCLFPVWKGAAPCARYASLMFICTVCFFRCLFEGFYTNVCFMMITHYSVVGCKVRKKKRNGQMISRLFAKKYQGGMSAWGR